MTEQNHDDRPESAPEHCPGTSSESAGKSDACAGCPNQIECSTAPKGPDPDLQLIAERLENVQKKILILSGKGGVGKSTVTAQLAFALARASEDATVGVLDVDLCGPSIPKLMGLDNEKIHQSSFGWSPVFVDDSVAVMSIGFMLPNPDDAVIWRGPKKNGMIKQFLRDVDWPHLSHLLIDTPPGTSDEHISIAQYLSTAGITGAILVTTPQEVSLQDVRKEISFCRKVGIRILGVVENMSGFVCPCCSSESAIFPATSGGAREMCVKADVRFLGAIPLDPNIGKACDGGVSFIDRFPDSAATKAYLGIVKRILLVCN